MMNTVDDVKQKLDIVDVVSQYVKLQKSGRNFKAACPFHSEKTASFFVFPEKQSWHCFGACGTGGDVFSFVMKKEGLDFSQALRLLAEKAGVTLTHQSQQNVKEEHEKHERLFKINEVAAEYFHYHLLHSQDGEAARQYSEKRGLTDKTIDSFQLGYSLDRWDDLSGHLMKSGYKEDEILAAGLIVLRDKGGYYDRFRNRLMFPIRDIKSRVVGFGGRALDDSLPKYLNSPQTSIFDKSSIVYAIDRAQHAIRQKDFSVVTEGYMDAITAHQYGFENTVACMGTSLTEKQISILRKYSHNIAIALDADKAGLEATVRSINPMHEPIPHDHWGLYAEFKTYAEMAKNEIQMVNIGGGKDPDELIRTSPDKWAKLLDERQPIIDITLQKIVSALNLNNPQDKSALISKFRPILAGIDDISRRAHYVHKLATLLQMTDKSLQSELFYLTKSESQGRSLQKTKKIADIDKIDSTKRIEIYYLALLIKFPNLAAASDNLDMNYFEHSENRDILLRWQLNSSAGIDAFAQSLDPAMRQYFDYLVSFGNRLPPSLGKEKKERERALNDCINRLQERHFKNLEVKKKLILAEEKSETQLAKLKECDINESQQLHDIFQKRGRLFSRTKGD